MCFFVRLPIERDTDSICGDEDVHLWLRITTVLETLKPIWREKIVNKPKECR